MMSEAERPVCLIPARGGSRRFPRKNIAPLRGRPLLAWDVGGYLRLCFGDQYARATQKLPEVRVDAGYFYFVRAESLRRERRLYGPRLVGYPIPRERAIDIDEPAHLVMAEALLDAAERMK